MKKLVLLIGVLILFSLALAGCGGSSSNSGGGEANHTHASTEGIGNQINKFLKDVSQYRVDEILGDHFLDSKSFTLHFLDEKDEVDESKTKDYATLARELTEEQKNNYDLKVELGVQDVTGRLYDTPGVGYCQYECPVWVQVTESNSALREGFMIITMRNYNNQPQWLCSEIAITKALYKDNTKAFGFHTYAGDN